MCVRVCERVWVCGNVRSYRNILCLVQFCNSLCLSVSGQHGNNLVWGIECVLTDYYIIITGF